MEIDVTNVVVLCRVAKYNVSYIYFRYGFLTDGQSGVVRRSYVTREGSRVADHHASIR